MKPLFLYLLVKLDDFRDLANAGAAAGFVISAIAAFAWCVLWSSMKGASPQYATSVASVQHVMQLIMAVGFSVGVLLAIANALLPSTKEMAVIYVVPKVVNSEVVQSAAAIPAKLLEMAGDWLKGISQDKAKNDGGIP